MKKSALFVLATLLSAHSFAAFHKNDVRAEPQISHGEIPHLQAVNESYGSKSPRDNDGLKWRYVGEHTPANLKIEKIRSNK